MTVLELVRELLTTFPPDAIVKVQLYIGDQVKNVPVDYVNSEAFEDQPDVAVIIPE